jgi:hypothetical protein
MKNVGCPSEADDGAVEAGRGDADAADGDADADADGGDTDRGAPSRPFLSPAV